MYGCRAFVLARAGRLADAQTAVDAELAIAEALGDPELSAVAAHDGGLVALEVGDYPAAAHALAAALHTPSRISRPMTRLARAEALARAGDPERATEEVRAAVLEPVRPSDFPAALVPRLSGVQGFIALAQGDRGRAQRCFEESVDGWTRLLSQAVESNTLVTVLADLGRPVVGLIEPERERRRALANLDRARTAPIPPPGGEHAVVS
jgi:tetratricopeptide (TPR) repeat protein